MNAAASRTSPIAALLDSARADLARTQGSIAARFAMAEALLLNGRNDEALAMLAALEQAGANDVALLARVAAIYGQAMAHRRALQCCERALRLRPDDCELLLNLAAAEVACGELEAARAHLRLVISLKPLAGPAYYNLAAIGRATDTDNHVDALRAALAQPRLMAGDEVPLRYALARELEDLREYRESFAQLSAGAARRRAGLSYRVEGDEAAMAAIARVFDATLLRSVSRHRGEPPVPIFVMGLPRSGTTLSDRILSSHSQVASLGEVTDFELAVVRAAGSGGKQDLIARSVSLDFSALGADYLRSIGTYGLGRLHLVDKTPRNYLYLGLIALALPQAAVVQVARDPMDTCYAMFKTLFGAGSPYSYHLDDLARYYIAWHRLMQHWREVLPGRGFDLSYESLIAEQEPTSRALLQACGLSWEPQCLQFHANATPAATASAAQVREPIHRRSLGLWRHYQHELAPLMERLASARVI